jgi:hypothetical protein
MEIKKSILIEFCVSRQYEQLAQQKEKSRLINQEGASQESLRYFHKPARLLDWSRFDQKERPLRLKTKKFPS